MPHSLLESHHHLLTTLFTSFIPTTTTTSLPLTIFSTTASATTATISAKTNRWNLLIIGGTVVAAFALGGTATTVHSDHFASVPNRNNNSPTNKSRSSKSRQDTKMFHIALYLAEKVSSLIPWRSAASALNATSNNRRSAIELGERIPSEQEYREEVDKLKQQLEEAKAKEEASAKVQEEVEALRDEVEWLRKELEGKRDDKGKQKASEEIDTTPDPEMVDPYLDGQDATSEEDVISFLGDLNAEIQDVAHAIARAFSNTRRPPPPLPSEELTEDLKEAIAGTLEILGPEMVELLQTPQRQGLCGEEEAVKIALKASMATYTHWIISSWFFENPEDEHLLSEIYARVRETEEQTVSGRWRALTRIHLQRMLAAKPDLTIYMVDAFVNIILTAGWHNDAAALQDYLIQTFGEKIGSVLERAKRLNKAIGEEIIKSDLEALYIAPDVLYNEMTMEVQIGDSGRVGPVVSPAEEKVLCTTELGLVKAVKKTGKVGEWEEAVLLKPCVILQSSVANV